MSGRKLDPVWVYFEKVRKTPGVPVSRAKCKKCGLELQGLTARLKKHHLKCSLGTLEPEDESSEQQEQMRNEGPVSVEENENEASTSQEPPLAKRKKEESRSIMDQFVVKTTQTQKSTLDLQIAKAVFATNSAFSCIEHPEVLKTIQLLRPGYIPPNRQKLSGKLLDEVYENMQEDVATQLKNKTVCFALDGWSNVHNEPIICASVTTESKVFLMKTIDTSGHSHTADYLTEVAKETIIECQRKTRCQVRSVVTDNTANVKKMRENLEKIEDGQMPNVITYGCSAHLLNLLAHDFNVPNIKKHVIEIMKYFRNNHFASAAYRKNGGKAFVLPSDVRWNTMADCLESYIKNLTILIKVCEENREEIDKNMASKGQQISLKRNAEDYLNIIKPIAVALDRMQRDSCTISEAVAVWRKLTTENLPEVCNARQLEQAKAREQMGITSAHLLAHLMDPKYRGKYLTVEEVDEALQYAHDKHPHIMPTLMQYQGQSAPFHSYFFEESTLKKVSTVAWWESFEARVDKEVLEVARQLHTAVASSAGVERVFSSFGFVHSKVRNRLGTEKAAKLVSIFKALNSNTK